MRIAYIIGDRGIPVFGSKGASIHVREMVNAFAGLGHEIVIFALKRGHEVAEINAEIQEITIKSNYLGDKSDTSAKLKHGEEQLIAVNENVLEALVNEHQQSPFDFIYERYSLFGTAGVRGSDFQKIPLIIEVNSPLINEQQNYRALYHYEQAVACKDCVFTGSTALAAVSDEIRFYLEAEGAKADRVHVIPNGVDNKKFNLQVQAAHIPEAEGRMVIGFVGSLKPWHGLEVLLPAFIRLENINSLHLLIIGEGPQREWIEDFIEQHNIQDRVTITGWVEHALLPGLIKAMTVAVAPYPDLEDFYFSPLKLYEYMAVGVPVIASEIGQIRQTINHGINGLLVKPGSIEDLSNALEVLLPDQPWRNQLGTAGHESVQNYTWFGNARRIIEIVEHQQTIMGDQ